MPVYDYRCAQCGTTYDVYHKVREIQDDVICPSCQSREHTKLMSVPAPSVSGGPTGQPDSCACGMEGECCGGACSMN